MALFDLTKKTSGELVELLKHENSWWWRQALLILQERGQYSYRRQLREIVRQSDDHRHRLRAMWTLTNVNAFDTEFAHETLQYSDSWVRAWTVRLLGQSYSGVGDATWQRLLQLARTDPSPDVRLQLASVCLRWREQRDPSELLQILMLRKEDAKDPVIPLLLWVAYEPGVVESHEKVLKWLADNGEAPLVRDHVIPRTMRRLVATGDVKHLNAALRFLPQLRDNEALFAAIDGLREGLRGQRLKPTPAWNKVAAFLFQRGDGVAERAVPLGLHFGYPESVDRTLKLASRADALLPARIEAVQGLALARDARAVEPLVRLATGEAPKELKREALRALASFDSEQVPKALLADWPKLPADLRTEVVGLMSGRAAWAHALLDAVQKGTLTRQDLTENDARRMLAFRDTALSKKVETVWGKLREQTPEKVEQVLVQFRKQLAEQPADRKAGQAVFEKHCMVCHKLNGKGHEVGPDLTGANRRDPEYLLTNILDPNRVVGRDYYSAIVADKSGRVHTGLLAEDTPQRVVLKGENAKLTVLPRADIEEMKIEEKSLMPEGLPNTMTAQQFRDLIAYLLEEPYLTRGLIAGPFKMALDTKGPVETSADPLKTDGVTWKPFTLGPTGVIDMGKLGVLAPPTDSTAYVYLEVVAPRAVQSSLEVAADDDVKVWLNGKEVHRRTRAVEPRRVPLELKEGTNRLLLKVHNVYGVSFVAARLSDPERVLELRVPRQPQ